MALDTVCDRCRKPVRRDPALGDRQGGPVDIVFQAVTHRLELCSDCITELREWIPAGVPISYSGTVRGMDAWHYIPRVGTGKPPVNNPGGKPLPPAFHSG